VIIKNLFTDLSNYKVVVTPKYTLKTKIKTVIKPKLVVGIKTLLDIMSIVLQNGRKRNQEGLNKQDISATLLFIKGTEPQVLNA